MEIKVNYQNSILINNKIYVDPLKVGGEVKAQYIFITHPHWDHFSIEDIKKILTSKTIIVCPQTMKADIENLFNNEIVYVEPNQNYEIGDIVVKTVSSYNINKQFHKKENNWVGYVLSVNGETVMIVGDSDNTPELNQVKTDILLVPIGGTYTMNHMEAAELVNSIKPKIVIPTHYGNIVGDKNMGNEFKKLILPEIVCELQLK